MLRGADAQPEDTQNTPGANFVNSGRVDEGRVPAAATPSTDEAHDDHADDVAEFALTTSDIRDCIAATEVAKTAESSRDSFDGIDIERWQSVLVEFERYIAALGDPSTSEAVELQRVNHNERAYAILHRGMDVNHCNAVFVHDMIRAISHGIIDRREGHSHNKLDHLAACVDAIFGVYDEDDETGSPTMAVSVCVSMTGGERATILKFSLSLEPSNEVDEESSSTYAALPPHLRAMSQVFECFASERTTPLRSQVVSIRETLSATREGAMDLQRRAMELQDELQVARDDTEEAASRQRHAEDELARQRYEFERNAESFGRVKEHYHAELARQKEGYERELRELKAELTKAKSALTERLSTERRKRKERNDGREEHQMSSNLHPTRNATFCVETNETGDDQISPPIPRNIEYGAIYTFDSDLGGSRGNNRRSRSETATPRNSRLAPLELQPSRRNRASLESKIRGTGHKTERDQGAMGGNDRRNPLKSVTENNLHHSTDARFSESRKPGNIHERSSRKNHQPHEDGNDRKDIRQTSNVVPSTKRLKVTENPYLKPAKNATKDVDSDNEPTFAYQEVVRGRANRQALPGHECEECRKWFDAIGPGYDRCEIVNECSRHRARHVPPSTPPDFWRLTFVDSIGSQKSSARNSI
jgi:hypothetical protein